MSSPGAYVDGKLVELLVGPDDSGERLDSFLASSAELPSRSACAKLVEEGRVTINSTPATGKAERVMLGDRVQVTLPAPEPTHGPLRPNFDIPLDVRFEDDYLIVLSKQAGLVVHPSPGPLQDLIRMRVLDRRYVTLVHGFVAPDEGTITTGIARSTRDRIRMMVSDDPLARQAITTFRVLERFEADRRDEGFTLMECHLYTGRTHQIRVHMRHVGHACVGDQLYGRGHYEQNLRLARQFLHSWHVAFDHPVTGEHIVLADTLPADLREALGRIGGRSMGRTAAGDEICPQLLA